jgi:hypothetical protein
MYGLQGCQTPRIAEQAHSDSAKTAKRVLQPRLEFVHWPVLELYARRCGGGRVAGRPVEDDFQYSQVRRH